MSSIFNIRSIGSSWSAKASMGAPSKELRSSGGQHQGWVHLESAARLGKSTMGPHEWLEVKGADLFWRKQQGGEVIAEALSICGCTVSVPKTKRKGWAWTIRLDLPNPDNKGKGHPTFNEWSLALSRTLSRILLGVAIAQPVHVHGDRVIEVHPGDGYTDGAAGEFAL